MQIVYLSFDLQIVCVNVINVIEVYLIIRFERTDCIVAVACRPHSRAFLKRRGSG